MCNSHLGSKLISAKTERKHVCTSEQQHITLIGLTI